MVFVVVEDFSAVTDDDDDDDEVVVAVAIGNRVIRDVAYGTARAHMMARHERASKNCHEVYLSSVYL